MYLFVRTRTCAPARLADATAFAVDVAAHVSGVTGLEVAPWQVEYGAPLTTFSWTTTVESHAEMGRAKTKLLADPGYLEMVAAGAELFEGPIEDFLVEILATAGDGGHRGNYASMVTAQCAAGKIGDAMAFGVDILNLVSGITGRDGVFSRSMYGPWATVGWITLAGSLDEIDAANAAMSADPGYLAKVDASVDLFVPGSGEARLTRRLT